MFENIILWHLCHESDNICESISWFSVLVHWSICLYEHKYLIVLRFRKGQRQPMPVLLPGKSHGWRSLIGCSPWGHKELDMTERLHFHFPYVLNSTLSALLYPGTSALGEQGCGWPFSTSRYLLWARHSAGYWDIWMSPKHAVPARGNLGHTAQHDCGWTG